MVAAAVSSSPSRRSPTSLTGAALADAVRLPLRLDPGFRNGAIAKVWFYPDGFDPDALSAVFSFD